MKHLDYLPESLDTEIKDWLAPTNPHDQACIAKACIALYNYGGGKLILGFDDKTLKPITRHFPKSVREIYHSDNLCPCIAKFAEPLFEVRVEFEKKNEQEHPIIEVPSGVRFPVINKSTDKEKKVFRRQNMVITRTLANHTVSSSEPQTPEDWDNLIQTCFDNRESDIGRFIRRHFISIQREMGSLDGKSPAIRLLDESAKSFSSRLDAWSKEFKFNKPKIYGLREVAFWIDGKIQSINCFLDKMLVVAQPRLSPRPPFIDGRRFHNKSNHPYTTSLSKREKTWRHPLVALERSFSLLRGVFDTALYYIVQGLFGFSRGRNYQIHSHRFGSLAVSYWLGVSPVDSWPSGLPFLRGS